MDKKNNYLYLKDYPKFTRKLINFINFSSSKIYCKYFKPDIIHKTFFNYNFDNNKKTKKIITVYDLIHEIYHNDFNKSDTYLPKKKFLNIFYPSRNDWWTFFILSILSRFYP